MKKVLLVLGMVALTFSMNAQTVLPTSLQDKQFKWEEKNQGKTFDVQLLSEEKNKSFLLMFHLNRLIQC